MDRKDPGTRFSFLGDAHEGRRLHEDLMSQDQKYHQC